MKFTRFARLDQYKLGMSSQHISYWVYMFVGPPQILHKTKLHNAQGNYDMILLHVVK